MKKPLFRFSTLRKPRSSGGRHHVLISKDHSSYFTSIVSSQDSQAALQLIENKLKQVDQLMSNEQLNTYVKLYNRLAASTNVMENQVVSLELYSEHFNEVFPESAEELSSEMRRNMATFGEMLTAIKLSSNRTRPEHQEVFIDLLKAWAIASTHLSLIETDKSECPFFDIYSEIFVVPVRGSSIPQIHKLNLAVSMVDEDRKLLESNIIRYKELSRKINQLDSLIDEVHNFEQIRRLQPEDLDKPEIITSIGNIPGLSKIGLQLRDERLTNSDIPKRNNSNWALIQNAKALRSKTLLKQTKSILPDIKISEKDIQSGEASNTLLIRHMELETEKQILDKNISYHPISGNYKDRDLLNDLMEKDPPVWSNLDSLFDLEDVKERKVAQGSLFELLVSDLVLIEEEVVGYVPSDIAHIENALDGELRSRTHRSLDKSEIRFSQSESAQVRHHINLATNSRHNFRAEIDDITQRKWGGTLQAGVKGKGPIEWYVDVSAYYDDEKRKVDKTINEAAKEITEEARLEVTRKIQHERSELTINEVEIINEHRIENASGNGHMNGIYHWVDQVREMTRMDYGRHLIVKLVLPNPANLLINRKREQEESLEDFPYNNPDSIFPTRDLFNRARKYNVHQIPIYPYREKTQTYQINFIPGESQAIKEDYAFFQEHIPLKEKDYEISTVEVSYTCPWYRLGDKPRKTLSINVLGNHFRISSDLDGKNFDYDRKVSTNHHAAIRYGWMNNLPGRDENKIYDQGFVHFSWPRNGGPLNLDFLPISIQTRNALYFEANISITLTLRGGPNQENPSKISKWQKEVYELLFQAYQRKKEEIEKRSRDSREEQLLHTISGANPKKNEHTIFEELKRQIIQVLREDTNHTFKGFFSNPEGNEEKFDIKFDEIRKYSALVEFFENAIDWEKMTYELYPYFWHESKEWRERQQFQDTDPLLESFLKAGAVQTLFPIKRGYERNFLHYMENGELWNHNEALLINSEEHLGIMEEVNEFLTEDEEESGPVQKGEPWRVRIPTNLIILSESNVLQPIEPLNNDSENGEDQ